jgi:hypothetical protein
MPRGDVHYVDVPTNIGWHMVVVLRESAQAVIIIFGQTEPRHGSHVVSPADSVAKEFAPHLVHATHFHKNNLAVIPAALMPAARLGHIDDDDLPAFLKAARAGFVLLDQISTALRAAGYRCQCQGGCNRHPVPCPSMLIPAMGHSVMDWHMTPSSKVVCRSCWEM